MNHRICFSCCKTCGKIFDKYDLKWFGHYPKYCCIECMNKSPNHIKKVGDTLEKRYGERVPAKILKFRQKMESTCLDKYGVKCAWN